MELLIDRVVVRNEEVEIRYVVPTSARSEHLHFYQLVTDYFRCMIELKYNYSKRGKPDDFTFAASEFTLKAF